MNYLVHYHLDFIFHTDLQGFLHWNRLAVLFVTGVLVGFFSGLLGKGGSAITTPALQIFAGIAPLSALASPLPATLPTTVAAAIPYRKQKLVNKRVVFISGLTGVPATVIGSFLSHWVDGKILMVGTGFFVFALGISFFFKKTRLSLKEIKIPIPVWKIRLTAAGVGLLSGLLANSGGVLFGPLFIRFLKMPTREALATSLVVSTLLAIPGTIVHWYLGHIEWDIVGLLIIGAIPTSYLGAKLALRMKSEKLEGIFAAMLTLFGAYDLFYTLFN